MADWIGFSGVGLLLVAFVMNVLGRLSNESHVYHAMNAVGAGVAGLASYLIGFIPFVVLEGVWCAVALAALLGWRPARR